MAENATSLANDGGGGGYKSTDTTYRLEQILWNELAQIDGVAGINPDTGLNLTHDGALLGNISTRLHGAPFQLLDSVDHRFGNINPEVGTEYLRNFLLNSPILYIHPGLPRYTGADPHNIKNTIQDIVLGGFKANTAFFNLAKNTLFGNGSKLQRRMYGFKQTYMDYCSHVNYACRSMAQYLDLSDEQMGTFVSQKNGTVSFQPFYNIRWENYRMINDYAQTVTERLGELASSYGSDVLTLLNSAFTSRSERNTAEEVVETITHTLDDPDSADYEVLKAFQELVNTDVSTIDSSYDTLDAQLTSVSFMVEPVQFQETLENNTKESFIEAAIKGVGGSIGSEIAFITGSKTDVGVLGNLAETISSGASTIATSLSGITDGVTGGWAGNLFRSAVSSMSGQTLIYPEIYDSSSSSMNYSFAITLSSPYGDRYNYYMNIVVPLLHLLCLASPRLITSNTTASPFLVQAYIPGMCTCQLGIISRMTIIKNPTTKHVSVDGYPLTVRVEFDIKELYNSMAISPANDPSSFLFNETLNDYLINLAGLVPSLNAYTTKQEAVFGNLSDYFTSGEILQSVLSGSLEWIESGIASSANQT